MEDKVSPDYQLVTYVYPNGYTYVKLEPKPKLIAL